jgi:hypothetical protein
MFTINTGIIKKLSVCYFQVWFLPTLCGLCKPRQGLRFYSWGTYRPESKNSNAVLMRVIISGDTIQFEALTDGMGVIFTFPKYYLWQTQAEKCSHTHLKRNHNISTMNGCPQPQQKTTKFSLFLKHIRNLAHLTRHSKCVCNMHTGPVFISLSGTKNPPQSITNSLETATPPTHTLWAGKEKKKECRNMQKH